MSLMIVSCVLLYVALNDKERYRTIFAFLGGVSMALAVLAHPIYILVAVYVFLMILIIEFKQSKRLYRSFAFTVGGFASALVITIYLTVRSGGLEPLFRSILLIPQGTYFNMPQQSLVGNIILLFEPFVLLLRVIAIGAVLFICIFAISRKIKKIRIDSREIVIFSLIGAQFISLLIYIVENALLFQQTTNSLSIYVNILDLIICFTAVLALLAVVSGWKKHLPILLILISPFILSYLLNIPFNRTGVRLRGYILLPGVMTCMMLNYYVLKDITFPLLPTVCKEKTQRACTLTLAIIICASFTFSYYAFVYHDQPINQLTYRMESGVYKGLYTEQNRGRGIIQLERVIREVTDESDYVYFRDYAQQAYLMTEANLLAPSSWDILEYSSNVSRFSDSLIHSYFDTVGQIPTKIIYVLNREINVSHPSIENEGFLFNRFVEENYIRTFTKDMELFLVIMYEKKSEID